MFLNEVSDDWLLCLSREGNQDAIDLLYERYSKFLYGIINEFFKSKLVYVDYKDMFQECIIVFLGCVQKYDEDVGCFYFFVKMAVERRLIDNLAKISKVKMVASLDELIYDNGNETLLDYVAESSDGEYNWLYEELVVRIDEESRRIVDLKMVGYAYHEIALILNTSKQSVYRRVVKIKNILKDIIEKID